MEITADQAAPAKGRRVYALYMKRPPSSTSLLYPQMGNIARDITGVRLIGRRTRGTQGEAMLDVILLALGLGFFALSIAYAFGCDRL